MFVRVTLAVLIASASIVPIYVIGTLVFEDWNNDLWLVGLYAALFVTTTGVVVVGLPAYFVLASLRKDLVQYYAGIGFIVPAAFVLLTRPFGEDGSYWIAVQSLQLGIIGACVATVFWLMAVWRTSA